MSDTNPNRVPAGVPTGGQFAASEHGESAVTLDLSPESVTGAALAQMQAEDAIRRYEGFTRSGFEEMGAGGLLRAAADLESTLPTDRAAEVRDARESFDVNLLASDPSNQAAVRTLHASMVDALSDAPTRGEIAAIRADLTASFNRSTDLAVDRDMGRATQADVDVEIARSEEIERDLRRRLTERQDAASMRVAQGRPTLYDLIDSQERINIAADRQRTARLNADLMRGSYVNTSINHPEIGRRKVLADQASAEERDAEAEYDAARLAHLNAHNAWMQIHGRDR